MFDKIKRLVFGAPRRPMQQETRHTISLAAFFAWIGLGADGLSSSAYGPEQSFLVLGHHVYLGLYLAVATAITVFVISLSYNQVIELFPSGGGGYKVASRLINSHAGLISGSALLLNYTLTIAVSFASAVDALFSLMPIGFQAYKIDTAVAGILIMMYLNLRGMKESIKFFMPIFLGFVITHFIIIIYGIAMHASSLDSVVQNSWHQTQVSSNYLGYFFIIALFMRSYCLGGGTYTGLEAVSNNVNNLAEPRVRTGKLTMLYMSVSLSLTAGGIILLYLLWHAFPVAGKTLNAVVFASILANIPYHHFFLVLILAFEAGLLFVGANTGFLGGPAVLSNMAIDGWVPKKFRNFSSRLVVQNGVLLFGVSAIAVLIWSGGSVKELVILYSLNVFITFSLSLFGLCRYWWQRRKIESKWIYRLPLSLVGFLLCSTIFVVTVLEKFTQGAWLTLLITGVVICIGLVIKNHYKQIKKRVRALDKNLTMRIDVGDKELKAVNPKKPTAVFFIGDSIGEGMHTLLWAQRMFAGRFKNFVFISAGVVDVYSYESETALQKMQSQVETRLQYFLNYAKHLEVPARAVSVFGADPVTELVTAAEELSKEFNELVFFSARLILKEENWLSRMLHNSTPNALQSLLHLRGLQMMILPVKV
ncbi:MAG: APC family permease [Gammaproteobacteria bacterium]|nr:APC family permease [Gammaproteobacteria bacterium]